MRQTRRGMIAQSGKIKYVWARYALTYGIDLSSATNGSFTLAQANYKRAATAYTVSSTGFALTNSVQTTAANLQVGQYLVNITTSSNTSTTGTYLYQITNITGTTTRTISYIRYSFGLTVKGTYIDQVESGTSDYPVNGPQDGYYYVMLRGIKPIYVWNRYTLLFKYKISPAVSVVVHAYDDTGYYSHYSSGYTLNTDTGLFTLNSPTYFSPDKVAEIPNISSKYWQPSPGGMTSMYPGPKNFMYYSYTSFEGQSTLYWSTIYTSRYDSIPDPTTYKIGTATGYMYESDDPSFYPQNGEQDGDWYVYSHSYLLQFDNT